MQSENKNMTGVSAPKMVVKTTETIELLVGTGSSYTYRNLYFCFYANHGANKAILPSSYYPHNAFVLYSL